MAKHRKGTALAEMGKLAKLGGVCRKCRRNVEVLSVDHIIPVAILDMLDDTGEKKYVWGKNMQLLCHPCNKFKGCRLDKTDERTFPLLSQLLK